MTNSFQYIIFQYLHLREYRALRTPAAVQVVPPPQKHTADLAAIKVRSSEDGKLSLEHRAYDFE